LTQVNFSPIPQAAVSGTAPEKARLRSSDYADRPDGLKLLKTPAGSGGRRNTCLQFTCRRLEAQGLSGTLVQAQRDLVELRL
jgi:hypothetical protein